MVYTYQVRTSFFDPPFNTVVPCYFFYVDVLVLDYIKVTSEQPCVTLRFNMSVDSLLQIKVQILLHSNKQIK